MPELPDVAVFANDLASTALHQRIARAEVRDASLLEDISANELASALHGRRLARTRRHGKYLFVEISGQAGWLVLHFGMTGKLHYFCDPEDEPPHTRLLIHFQNGCSLAYDCQRKLGLISLTTDPQAYRQAKHLGPDALAEGENFDRFQGLLGSGRGAIKSALMNQEALAGIGNVYSDEILFHARVHPQRKVKDLSPKELRAIYRALHKVLPMAIERRVDPAKLPRGYLLPQRHDQGRCPRCRKPIIKKKIAGRTAYLCEQCQR